MKNNKWDKFKEIIKDFSVGMLVVGFGLCVMFFLTYNPCFIIIPIIVIAILLIYFVGLMVRDIFK